MYKALSQYSVDPATSTAKSLDYLLYFRKNCTLDFVESKIVEKDCAFDQMRALGIDDKIVNQCFLNSFIRVGDVDSFNEVLDGDAKVQEELGIYLHPGLTINNITYRGYIEGEDVKEAICSSFT